MNEKDTGSHTDQEQTIPLGITFLTRGASEVLTADDIATALSRHASGDWGEVCEVDKDESGVSLRGGFRRLSVHRTPSGATFWVITEADRSATTVLLPEEH